MSKKWREKLHSRAGETITEVLIALLVSALALTMLATMISSTVSMIQQSKESMKNYYDMSIVLEEQKTGTTGTASINTSGSTGSTVSESASVNLYKNDFFTSEEKKVYAYAKTN